MAEPSPTARNLVPIPGASYKLIYLAQRNPALDAPGFAKAWREHSQLAAKFTSSLGSHFRGVHQCIKDDTAVAAVSFENRYDGSSILAMKSWEDLLAARYHPHSLDEMLKDEQRVFAGAVDNWTMAVEEHVLLAGEPQENALLSFLTPRPDQSPEEFSAMSRSIVADLSANIREAVCVVWNGVVDKARDYPFAAVVEVWFATRAATLAATRDRSIVAALEQTNIADPSAGARLVARLNHAKAF